MVYSNIKRWFSLIKLRFEAHICQYVGQIHHFWSFLALKQPRWAPGEYRENPKYYLEACLWFT